MGSPVKINQLFDFSAIPDGEQYCVYSLFNDKGVCIYVGQTKQLKSRVYSHFRDGKDFIKFTFDMCEESEASELEAREIVKMQPTLNKTLPSNDSFINTTMLKTEISKFITDNEDRLPIVFTGALFSKANNKKYVRMHCYNEVIACITNLLSELKEGEQ